MGGVGGALSCIGAVGGLEHVGVGARDGEGVGEGYLLQVLLHVGFHQGGGCVLPERSQEGG